ncbi:MAG: hypothetical protein EXS18_03785 [Verrucomicrobiae bacterium]|nr:hypothetical protein [Verrucomicrobiae bacterium]
MRKATILLLLLMTGCSQFSGTRYADIPAEQYNYLKGQRVAPEEIGIQVVHRGAYAEVVWPRGISGDAQVFVPLNMQGGAVSTPVVVNGTMRVPGVIDTGAPFNLASLRLAYRLELPVTRPASLPQKVFGYGGASAECGWSLLKSLQIGDMTFTNALAMIPLETFERVTLFGNITINNDQFIILGLDDMARMSYVTFDFPGKRFVLAREQPFHAQEGDSFVVPCAVNPGPTLMVTIKVDGKGPFPCRIDTGKTYQSPALTIPQQLAKELGYWRESGGNRSNHVGIGGSFETQRFALKTFEMGGKTFANLTADTHEGAREFILGLKFLRQYRMTIDFRSRTICFEK